MPSPTSPATPHRDTSDTRSHPGTPNTRTEGTSTPNTRKRARLDYPRLHNSPPRIGSSFLDESSDENIENDIDTYLDTPTVKYFGSKTADQEQWILDWWNTNKSQYVCMSRVARDYLAIPASQVGCERLFSGRRDLLGIRR
jgi:hypothetical protein